MGGRLLVSVNNKKTDFGTLARFRVSLRINPKVTAKLVMFANIPEVTYKTRARSTLPPVLTVLRLDSTSRAGQLRIPTNNPIQQPGSADLYAFEQQQPGVLQQLFPSFFGDNRAAAPTKRSKRS